MIATRGRRRQRGERGISLPEVTVTLFLMSVIGIMFYQLYLGTIRTTMFLESNNDLAGFGQQAVNELKLEVMQSRTLFQNDTLGQSYEAALAIPSDRPRLSGSRLPTADVNGDIEPDASGETFTGNSFLQVRQLNSFEANVDHDGSTSTANVDFFADRYRFQYYYLGKRDDAAILPLDFAVDLVEYRSEVYADYFQLNGLDPTFAEAVGTALYNEGIRWAWDPGEPAGSAFYRLASDGTLSGPDSSHNIVPARVESMLPQLRGGRVSGSMKYSVGIQKDPAFETEDEVSVYGVPNGLFPSGFEVKIIGATGARKIYIRLMLMAQYQDKLHSHANAVTVTTAEF